jgi:dihydroxyacetone kinase-like protein
VNTLGVEFWLHALDRLVTAFQEAEVRLCGCDGAIGDGDHGTSMLEGFRKAQKAVRDTPPADSGEVLRRVGRAFLEKVGGVTGIVFGSVFDAAGENAAGVTELDAGVLCRALSAGLAAAQKRGRAAEGDKSMVDALAPAVAALQAAAERGEDAGTALARAAEAAEAGMEATIAMEAKVGRARYQPGKGAGHVDAGASSVFLIFQTLAAAAAST